ncbi:MAG: Ig domain-containing protein, partial [bacterium]
MEDGVINRSYSKTLDTTGGTPPLISCTFSGGTPPPGLVVNPVMSTCVVSGVPTMAGTFAFTVRAEDSNNISDTQDYTVVIRDEFTITGLAPDPLPDGVEDAAYNFMFTVTTDTVQGPNDFGQVLENGNGPITMCTLGGLPAGMMAVGGTFTANSCVVTISGAPNIGLGPMSAPMTFMLTLTVVDTAIGGSNTPAGMVTQTAIDLTIQPPVSITLITTDVASTAGCTGGTFDDSTGGGAAPDGVNGRTYGDPQCDLLFAATGGIAPYTWTDNSAMPPAPFGCAQEGGNNEFFRCNSGMAALMT